MQSAIAQSTLRAEEEPWGTEKPEAFSVDRRAFSTSHGSLPSKFVGKLKNLYFFFFALPFWDNWSHCCFEGKFILLNSR